MSIVTLRCAGCGKERQVEVKGSTAAAAREVYPDGVVPTMCQDCDPDAYDHEEETEDEDEAKNDDLE